MPAVVRFDPFRDITTLPRRDEPALQPHRRRGGSASGSAWTPAVDIFDTDKAIVLKAELPGLHRGHRHRDRRERPHPAGRAAVRGDGGGGALLPPGAGVRALPAQPDPAAGREGGRDLGDLRRTACSTVRVPKADEVKPRKIAVAAGAGGHHRVTQERPSRRDAEVGSGAPEAAGGRRRRRRRRPRRRRPRPPERGARRVPRRAPAAEGRVRQLPQAQRARAPGRGARRRPRGRARPAAGGGQPGARRRRPGRPGRAGGRGPGDGARRSSPGCWPAHGVEEIDAHGRPFDPTVHEASRRSRRTTEEGPSSRWWRRATATPTRCCGPRASSSPPSRRRGRRGARRGARGRPLRHPRRPRTANADEIKKAYRKLARSQPPGREPGRRQGRGALQGDLPRPRRALRPGQAPGVRRPAAVRRPRARRRGSAARAALPRRRRRVRRLRGHLRRCSAAAPAAREPAARRGADVEVEVNLSFDQAMRAPRCPCRWSPPVACADCGGTGAKPGTSPRLCPECKGRGVLSRDHGPFAFNEPCPRCGGNGTVIDEPCPTCHGAGSTLHALADQGQDPGRGEGRHPHPPQGQGPGRARAAARRATSRSSPGWRPAGSTRARATTW